MNSFLKVYSSVVLFVFPRLTQNLNFTSFWYTMEEMEQFLMNLDIDKGLIEIDCSDHKSQSKQNNVYFHKI